MARDYQINGEVMVSVKGMVGSSISSLSQLGLTDREGIVRISPRFIHEDIPVDAWGDAPPEIQFFLSDVTVSMTLVHYDEDVLDEVVRLSMGGGGSAGVDGVFPRAGTRMGGGVARFAAGNKFIGLNLSSPVGGKPWRFYFTYLSANPFVLPLGTRRSHTQLMWRAIPYTIDPWNAGAGANGTVIWDHTLDT
jgi:hypothetical protein